MSTQIQGVLGHLTAFITLEIKNNHVHAKVLTVLNKFIGMKFSLRCMIWSG